MTVKSMTAFARSSGEAPACHWTWEIKSVNAKGLDIRFRMPPGFDALDIAIRERTAKVLKRGNLFIALTLTWRQDATSFALNEDFLKKLAEIQPLLTKHFPVAAPLSQDGLLTIKGVVETVDAGASPDVLESLNAPLLASYDEALNGLVAMRSAEGARLAATLEAQIYEVNNLKDRASDLAATQPEVLRNRLKTQLADIRDQIPALSEDRLAQEVAILITKADIREELDRLSAHVAAARDLLAAPGAVGRKLDFLCQEFNREANTLCSKSQATELTTLGLELKAVIEQFREQVQNIE